MSEAVPEAAIVPLCAFAVGEQEYVIDVMRIRSIVRPLPVTAVPHAPPSVEGMVELRGSVIPVVDLRKRLGAPPVALGPCENGPHERFGDARNGRSRPKGRADSCLQRRPSRARERPFRGGFDHAGPPRGVDGGRDSRRSDGCARHLNIRPRDPRSGWSLSSRDL